jgi:hypothetical protein
LARLECHLERTLSSAAVQSRRSGESGRRSRSARWSALFRAACREAPEAGADDSQTGGSCARARDGVHSADGQSLTLALCGVDFFSSSAFFSSGLISAASGAAPPSSSRSLRDMTSAAKQPQRACDQHASELVRERERARYSTGAGEWEAAAWSEKLKSVGGDGGAPSSREVRSGQVTGQPSVVGESLTLRLSDCPLHAA